MSDFKRASNTKRINKNNLKNNKIKHNESFTPSPEQYKHTKYN